MNRIPFSASNIHERLSLILVQAMQNMTTQTTSILSRLTKSESVDSNHNEIIKKMDYRLQKIEKLLDNAESKTATESKTMTETKTATESETATR